MPQKETSLFFRLVLVIKISIIVFIVFFVLFLIMDNIIMPMYVHLGDEVDMPDVTEMADVEALAKLKDYGFKIKKEEKYDSYRSAGIVLDQSPPAFTSVKKGRLVRLTVSLGEKKVPVPDLIGISERDAEIRLQESSLKLGKKYRKLSSYPEGTVISQLYQPMMQVSKGTEVSITVSLGQLPDEIIMPNVINKNVSDAVETVEKKGLIVGELRFQIRNNLLPSTVIKQIPAAGHVMALHDTVYLTISRIDTIYSQKDINNNYK